MKQWLGPAFRMAVIVVVLGACILKWQDPGLTEVTRALLVGCGAVWLICGVLEATLIWFRWDERRHSR